MAVIVVQTLRWLHGKAVAGSLADQAIDKVIFEP